MIDVSTVGNSITFGYPDLRHSGRKRYYLLRRRARGESRSLGAPRSILRVPNATYLRSDKYTGPYPRYIPTWNRDKNRFWNRYRSESMMLKSDENFRIVTKSLLIHKCKTVFFFLYTFLVVCTEFDSFTSCAKETNRYLNLELFMR